MLKLALGIAVAFSLQGCGSSDAPPDAMGSRSAGGGPAATWSTGRLNVAVPVPVITVGLSSAATQQLQAALAPLRVDHASESYEQLVPLEADDSLDPGLETVPLPIVPTAHFEVRAATPALQRQLLAALVARGTIDGTTLYDGNAVEAALAQQLHSEGLLDPSAPPIVLLHLAGAVGPHAWRYEPPRGGRPLAPVRVFGERSALLVLDPSAVEDPFAGSGGYRSPAAADDAATLADFVRGATQYRLLQGSLYPVPVAPCHAITVVVGERRSLADATGLGLAEGERLVHRLEDSFNALVGGGAIVDLKVLQLPDDDPALDVAARSSSNFYEQDGLRSWVFLNWDRYHVDRPGCEEYLTFAFESDTPTPDVILGVPPYPVVTSFGGMGFYDDSPGQRMSLIWMPDRLFWGETSPTCLAGAECLRGDYYAWIETLMVHETGHILGQRHPHDITHADGAFEMDFAFSSIWSVMSYQPGPEMTEFGAIDRNNWARNRAGFAFEAAARQGREGSAAWNAALRLAARQDWPGVWETLQPAP